MHDAAGFVEFVQQIDELGFGRDIAQLAFWHLTTDTFEAAVLEDQLDFLARHGVIRFGACEDALV